MIKHVIALCALVVFSVGCAGMGTGKSKIVFTDKDGNPVIVEHEVVGPPEKEEPK